MDFNVATLILLIISFLVGQGFILWVANKIFKFGQLHNRFTTLEKHFGKLENQFDKLKDKLGKVVINIHSIKAFLVTEKAFDAKVITAMSPVRLTDKGTELVKKTGFDKIYIEDKQDFIKKFKSRNVKTLADIDGASNEILEVMKGGKRLSHFKDVAFQNGTTLDLLLKLCAIYLRDEVAKELKIK